MSMTELHLLNSKLLQIWNGLGIDVEVMKFLCSSKLKIFMCFFNVKLVFKHATLVFKSHSLLQCGCSHVAWAKMVHYLFFANWFSSFATYDLVGQLCVGAKVDVLIFMISTLLAICISFDNGNNASFDFHGQFFL
jgi:hypothetical protein